MVDQHAGLDEPDYPWWSRALRQLRRRFDLSQRELAEKAGLAPSTIAELELGRAAPSVRLLEIAFAAVGFRLILTDCGGEPIQWSLADDSQPRDAGGRRYPAHLDVRPRHPGRPEASPTEGMTATRSGKAAPDPLWSLREEESPWTYRLCRTWRDADRIGGRFGEWGAGPPAPAQFDAEYIRDVLGMEKAAPMERDPLDGQLRHEFLRRHTRQRRSYPWQRRPGRGENARAP
jgi:transcriptional regulator with XRE-family HTH domain